MTSNFQTRLAFHQSLQVGRLFNKCVHTPDGIDFSCTPEPQSNEIGLIDSNGRLDVSTSSSNQSFNNTVAPTITPHSEALKRQPYKDDRSPDLVASRSLPTDNLATQTNFRRLV